nr:ribonuclease H-like domain, reverse transcriptase, RNA-dependent DNA polymerase [Tanacetum cinerariifolium]
TSVPIKVVVDEAVYEEMNDSVERAAFTATGLDADSTMASAIICLATNQKFNFSKYIFDSMVKHLDSGTKFLIYPRKRLFKERHTLIPNYDSASTRRIRKTRKKDTELPQTSVPIKVVVDEAVYEEINDSVERAAFTATGLDAEQDRGIISKTQFMTTLNEPSSIRTSLCSRPKCQETIGDAAA